MGKQEKEKRLKYFIKAILPILQKKYKVEIYVNGSMYKIFTGNKVLDYYPKSERCAVKGKDEFILTWFDVGIIELKYWIKTLSKLPSGGRKVSVITKEL